MFISFFKTCAPYTDAACSLFSSPYCMYYINSLCQVDLPFWQAAEAAAVAVAVAEDPMAAGSPHQISLHKEWLLGGPKLEMMGIYLNHGTDFNIFNPKLNSWTFAPSTSLLIAEEAFLVANPMTCLQLSLFEEMPSLAVAVLTLFSP